MTYKKYVLMLPICIVVLGGCKESPEQKQETQTAEKSTAQMQPTLIAEVDNMVHCESVAYDTKRNVLYVSVQGENEAGDGSIAKIGLNGEVLDRDYIGGLNNPKGIAVTENRLYVSDVTELVEVDLESGKILKKHTRPEAEFLNDVTIDQNGNVYVSDMFTSSIYVLDNKGSFSLWHTSPEMENPNGLLAVGTDLYLGSWGRFTDKNPGNAPQGGFKKIDLKSKTITEISPGPIGNLDGVQVYDSSSFLLSDWISGGLLKISAEGAVEKFMETAPSVGDILYLPEKKLLALPMNKPSQLLLYDLK